MAVRTLSFLCTCETHHSRTSKSIVRSRAPASSWPDWNPASLPSPRTFLLIHALSLREICCRSGVAVHLFRICEALGCDPIRGRVRPSKGGRYFRSWGTGRRDVGEAPSWHGLSSPRCSPRTFSFCLPPYLPGCLLLRGLADARRHLPRISVGSVYRFKEENMECLRQTEPVSAQTALCWRVNT